MTPKATPWYDRWWLWVIVLPAIVFGWNFATTGDPDGRPGVTCHTADNWSGERYCLDDETGQTVMP